MFPLRHAARHLALAFLLAPALHADIASARTALEEGRVQNAASQLGQWLAAHPGDSEAHLLFCRAFYSEEFAEDAVTQCEAAAASAPGSSDVHMWLGRAEGMKASSANPVVAFSIARKVRDAFERAAALDPGNLAAASDLGEFYVAAPPIVGGGVGKARDLAARLEATHQPAASALSHRILALLAEKTNDMSTAEAEFRRATAGSSPGAWVDLGAFYARRRQGAQAEVAARTAVDLDKLRGPVLVDAASVLIDSNRNPTLAAALLREYLASPARSDAAPAFKVHLQLGRLLDKTGDHAGAHHEFLQAYALAPNFPAARNAAGQGSR